MDADGNEYDVEYVPAELTVRYVSEPDKVITDNDHVAEPIYTDMASILADLDRPAAVIPQGSEFATNDIDGLYLLDTSIDGAKNAKIALMSDELLSGTGDDRELQLRKKAEEKLKEAGKETEGRSYDFKYLDLINTTDGNIWVSSSLGLEIYWPYPDGTDETTEFTVIHFKGLHREYGFDSAAEVEEAIENSEAEIVQSDNTEKGIHFTVGKSGFSPFAISWTKSDDPSTGPGTDVKPDPEPDPDVPVTPPEDDTPSGGGGHSGGGGSHAINKGYEFEKEETKPEPIVEEDDTPGYISPHPEYNKLPIMGAEILGPAYSVPDDIHTVPGALPAEDAGAEGNISEKGSDVSETEGVSGGELDSSGSLDSESTIKAVIPELSGLYEQNNDLIGKRIMAARKLKNISQIELARELGVASSTISNLEKGKCMVGFELLIRILRALELGVDELLPELVKSRTGMLKDKNSGEVMEIMSLYDEEERQRFLSDMGRIMECMLGSLEASLKDFES